MSGKRIVIFSGTTEGRMLSEALAARGIPHIVSVATGYGSSVMKEDPLAEIRTGRMDAGEMAAFLKDTASCVCDATHPYAEEASSNIRKAAASLDLPYMRVLREGSEVRQNGADSLCGADAGECGQEIRRFGSAEECAKALEKTEGAVLLTTGSRELSVFCASSELRERLYVRVLPSEESIRLCREAGLEGRQILAMQGPFSEDLNRALIRDLHIRILVTKDGGTAGGFPGKMRAAQAENIPVYLIRRPAEKEAGISYGEALRMLLSFGGNGRKKVLDLIGAGPGDLSLMTEAAREAAEKAEILFGAPRVLEAWTDKKSFPYYRAEDILPVLRREKPERAAVLFSGDSGFYSGAGSLLAALKTAVREDGTEYEIRVHPGISSVSLLSAKTGISYSGAGIFSLHGRSDDAEAAAELEKLLRTKDRVFVLLSGAGDVRRLGTLLEEDERKEREVVLGYRLSYPDESIRTLSFEDCNAVEQEGLYLALIRKKENAS